MKNRGFVEIILAVIILVIILSLFGVSLAAIFDNETLKNNFGFIWDWVRSLWGWFFYRIFAPAKGWLDNIF